MKRLALILIGVVVFAVPAYAQPLTPEQKKGAEEVMATISKWATAVAGRDLKALDQIFAEDLFVTLPDGKTRRKADEMKALEPNPSVRMLSVANEDVEVRMMGDAAVVTAVTKMRMMRDKTEVPVTLRSTSAFAKRDGRWQLVVLQIAFVSPPSAAVAAPATKQ
jgi:ketosteroid isomerase-like protein